MKYIIPFLWMCLMVQSAMAQVDTTLGADDLFTLAREKAFNGEREEARSICRLALRKNPGYTEIQTFIGRTYAWDGRREEARAEFKEVLSKDPENIEATLAIADVELWDDKPEQALIYLNKALGKFPNDYDLLFKKAKALVDARNDDEALLTLAHALEISPGSKESIELKERIKGRKFRHSLYVNVSGDFYSSVFDPMYYSTIQFGTVTNLGSIMGRLNYANRFGDNGIQPEVDFYPRLWKGAYGYLNYGFTTSSLFPSHRVGGEIFQSLPRSMEASAGVRYLYFGPGSDVTIYTLSVGWYFKSYWFNARTYLTPGEGSFSRSLTLTARKYFGDANNYIGMFAGAGFSPDARRIQTNTGLDAGNDIYFLKSQRAGIILQKNVRYNMNLLAEVYYSNQEMSFSYGDYLHIIGFTTGLKIRL